MQQKYIDILNIKVAKLMTDEISAATFYLECSSYLTNLELAEEIRTHSKEEFDHFTILMDYAVKHNIKRNYDFDRKVIKNIPTSDKSIIAAIQKLEKTAVANYRELTLLARENDDLESEELFAGLLKAEMTHFDDIAQYTGEKRTLGESFKSFKKFSDEFNSRYK